jgi:hypothetical protein
MPVQDLKLFSSAAPSLSCGPWFDTEHIAQCCSLDDAKRLAQQLPQSAGPVANGGGEAAPLNTKLIPSVSAAGAECLSAKHRVHLPVWPSASRAADSLPTGEPSSSPVVDPAAPSAPGQCQPSGGPSCISRYCP